MLLSATSINLIEGELVGEAYCADLLGQRMSIWEADALHQVESVHEKEAETVSRENRQRIQQEASSGKRALAQETRRLEKQRLMERQRSEIHPEHVQAALQVLEQEHAASPPLPRQPMGLLPLAVPEDEAPTTPVVRLQIRKRGNIDDEQ